jgi:hypothetical protein
MRRSEKRSRIPNCATVSFLHFTQTRLCDSYTPRPYHYQVEPTTIGLESNVPANRLPSLRSPSSSTLSSTSFLLRLEELPQCFLKFSRWPLSGAPIHLPPIWEFRIRRTGALILLAMPLLHSAVSRKRRASVSAW